MDSVFFFPQYRSGRLQPVLLALLALLLLSSALQEGLAQDRDERPRLTLEDIYASSWLSPQTFRGGRWADEGPVVTYIEQDEQSGVTHLMSYNLQTGERTKLIDGTELYAEDVDRRIDIEGYQYSQDERKVLLYTDAERVWRLPTKGFYYIFDLQEKTLQPLSDRSEGFQQFAKFNPAGDKVAFVRQRNLYLADLDTGEETALTEDGAEGTIINGTFDWVYEEEFGLRDGFAWGPEGRYIAFFKLDESQTRDFAMTDFRTRYPTYERFRYPKAGEDNSEIQVGVIDLSTQETRFFDTGTWKDDTNEYEYLARMGWTPEVGGAPKVWMYRLNRDQNQLDLLYGDPQSGTVERVLQEEESTWIEIDDAKLTFLNDGQHFVWMSETDGYRHLYLHRTTGERVKQLTAGEWEVTSFHGVDEAAGLAYFTGTKESPLERHLYRIPFDTEPGAPVTEPERITEQRGWHDVDMASDYSYFVDTYSNVSTPPVVTLREADGTVATTLEGNETLIERLEQYRLPHPEFTTIPGADSTALNAWILKPSDFDANQTYPTLLYVYGGPGSQTVGDSWDSARGLWHRYLAEELGVVVVSVDNRGTGGRGKAFKSATYRQLGILETEDQIAAGQYLAQLDYVDEDRLGIWGWSYGGYMTLLSMLYGEGPETFTFGVSVAPVTTWRAYDTIYTERYMSTPQRNPDGYDAGSPIRYADRLTEEQDLLIVHGDFDDNVHLQNTMQMVESLQIALKQFDLMIYPGRDHGISGGLTRLHLFEMITEYIEQRLVSSERKPVLTD